jgi:hypothetical protein
MKVASPLKAITSIRFRQRARPHHFAAAISKARRDAFLDLAVMFERLFEHVARAEARMHSL